MRPRAVSFMLFALFVFQPCRFLPAAATTQPDLDSADPDLPKYVAPEQPLNGDLFIGGSGTMDRVIRPILDAFADQNRAIRKKIELRGSSTTPNGLATGQFNFGLMSRQMTEDEKKAFKNQAGKDVIEIIIAYDAIQIRVNKNNPIDGISLPELDAIYGSENRAGHKTPITTWGDLGVKGDLAGQNITAYGALDGKEGTSGTFRKIVLLDGPFSPNAKEMVEDVTVEFGQNVAKDPSGISFGILNEPVDGARNIPVALKEGRPFIMATPKTLADDSYPLTRPLYAYLADKSNPVVVEFVKFILSRDGQQIVAGTSVSSLSAGEAARQAKAMAE